MFAGNYEQAGVIGEIVSKVDRLSTSLNVGANPERILQAPETSQQRQWLLGLQALVKFAEDQKQLNVRGQPYWLTKDSLWLVSKVAANNLRALLLKQGLDNVPSNNNILFDELQSHAIIQATPSHRAIWKIRIEDGDWSVDLTCVRIQPSLIWGSEEYPPTYSGRVSILGDGESAAVEDETATPDTATRPPPPITTKQQAVADVTLKTTESSSQASAADDGVDELLNLFSGMDTTAPATLSAPAQPETFEAAAASSTTDVEESLPEKPQKNKEAKPHPKKLDDVEKQGRKVLAEEFLLWLKDGIAGQRFLVNDTNAKIHIVESQLFIVTPGIFQRFCLEQTGQDESWRKVQQGFEKLKLHKKRPDDLNIWACAVKGPRKAGKRIQGYLLEPTDFFSDTPMNNPFLTLVE
jgi:hypothetical protein